MPIKFWRRTPRRRPIITMTTDFGGTHYQSLMEGIIYSINPEVRVVTVTQHIRSRDVRGAAFVMKTTLPYYPYGIHLGIVFPTGGMPGFRNLVVDCKGGVLVGPDNGILMPAARELGLRAVYEASNPAFGLSTPSNTHMAVEACAPLAAQLSMGLSPEEVGLEVREWVEMDVPRLAVNGESLEGETVFIDNLGNIVTNIPGRDLAKLAGYNDLLEVQISGKSVRLPLLKTANSIPKGEMYATLNSYGLLELSAHRHSASRQLSIEDYGAVRVRRFKPEEDVLTPLPP